jgi:hypothetical protein
MADGPRKSFSTAMALDSNRRNDEIHVTDFGGFDGAAWLG